MKFNRLSLFISSLLAITAHAEGEDIVGSGISITKYDINGTLINMLKPPAVGPEHLQYIIGLDQAGLAAAETGIKTADPEYAATLSSGTFDRNVQKINRCYGGGWSMFDVKSTELPTNNSTLSNTGRGFLSEISRNDKKCNLTFTWNKEFSKASISGYMDALVAGKAQEIPFVPGIVADFFGGVTEAASNRFSALSIELTSYWKWKFGLDVESSKLSDAEKKDFKCCPPKKNSNHSCLGPNKLGKEGQCETISKACGDIKQENFAICAMYERKNSLKPSLLKPKWMDIPPEYKGYLVYPLADKYGTPTPFYEFYMDAVKAQGLKTVFHGVKRVVGDEL